MRVPAVVWGLGQMGGAFAHALLKAGHPVHPVTRETDPDEVAAIVESPLLCLLAVGEEDLAAVVPKVPAPWRHHLGLLQNELLPCVWEDLGVSDPTVAVVWFEKKKNVPITPVQSTPIAGPRAELLVSALEGLGVPAHVIGEGELLGELVKKNLYILTANASALAAEVDESVTVGELSTKHRALVEGVARDALSVQAHLAGVALSDALIEGVWSAFAADPTHRARGRSAPARLERALAIADEAGLDVPALRALSPRR